MLGDIAPLPAMVAAVKKHPNTMILCDEAHGMGFIGKNGRGVFEELGCEDDIDFVVGTFSKSVGTVGGFCVSNHRSEEHTSELQSLMRISYAVFCLKQ